MDLTRLKKRSNNTDERSIQSSAQSLHLKRQQPDISKSRNSGSNGSPSKIKREKDASNLKPTFKNPRHPSTGLKFERPNTRRARYVSEIQHTSSKTSSIVSKAAESGSMHQSDINRISEDRNIHKPERHTTTPDLQNQSNTSTSIAEPPQTTSSDVDISAVKVESPKNVPVDWDGDTTCNIESGEANITCAPSAMPSTPENNQPSDDVPQDTSGKPLPPPIIDIAQPSTPISIPAQIAVIEASPSKRVAFSPNKQESRFSNPNNIIVGKLKSILKPVPLRIEGGELVRSDHDTGSVYLDDSTTKKGESSSNQIPENGAFVKAAIASLESGDSQLWASIYIDLQLKFRAGDDKLYLDEARESMRAFAACLSRDLELSNPPSLVQAALKCTSYFFYNQSIVSMFTKNETEAIVAQILNLINEAAEKIVKHYERVVVRKFAGLKVKYEQNISLRGELTE
ncbi:hypothetical protein BGZ76_000548 [Entomortierella beljakovae]|nr:hypothetical protein BGZ76_000548 [Entomortierella beljakovae]